MPDKAGDRFTDKTGKTYELRPDPKGGHLRPYAAKDGNPLNKILTEMITPIVGGGLRWIWDKFTKRKK